MPRTLSAVSPRAPEYRPRRRCWTVCEDRSSFCKVVSEPVADDGATPTTAPFCRANSLRISIEDAPAADPHESSHCLLSPCTSPSFSFDNAGDFFAAMNSPVLRCPLLITEASSSTTRLRVLSPTIKRQRKNTSGASTVSSSTTSVSATALRSSSRRYTSILSRCLPRQLKSSRDTIPCSPRDSLSRRATEITVAMGSVASATSCSHFLAASSPSPVSRRRFGTVLLSEDCNDLRLLRDEAEYSDYINASVSGSHSEVDSVVFYELDVHLSQINWKLYRRFSEFRALRQDLIKHFSKRLRHQSSHSGGASAKCEICADMLDAIEQNAFPSRQQTHRHWHRLFSGNSAESSGGSAVGAANSAAAVIADRKAKFADFVGVCLRTMRGLRQHANVMEDSSACEIGTALRMIEEFFGLSFTRYLRFLNERGVVSGAKGDSGRKSSSSAVTASRRRQTTSA